MTSVLERKSLPTRKVRQRARRAPEHGESPIAQRARAWKQSWGLALRSGSRDLRQHRGRAVLILIMIGLPVMLISAFVVGFATTEVTPAKVAPALLGNAAARMYYTGNESVEQLPDASNFQQTNVRYPKEPPTPTMEATAKITGGMLSPVGETSTVVTVGEGIAHASTLQASASTIEQFGLARLIGGRWPASVDEVLIGQRLVDRGVSAEGPLMIMNDDKSRTVQVVGVAAGRDSDWKHLDLMMDFEGPPDMGSTSLLLDRDTPVTWTEVQEWNRSGLVVLSAAVLADPPPNSQVSSDLLSAERGGRAGQYASLAAIGIGLLVVMAMLAGPAFAVAATRQRDIVALLASTGAPAKQLRRYLLGQSLLLGLGASVVGALLGIPLAAAGLWLLGRGLFGIVEKGWVAGPFDVWWSALALLVAVATLAAVVAAALPARGVARLDIAAVLAGRGTSRPPRRLAPVLGVLLILAGAGWLIFALVVGQQFDMITGLASGVLAAGFLLLVPLVLRGAARVSGSFGVAARLAANDAVRQRSRTVSAVAAVTVTVAMMTLLVVGNASGDAQLRLDYQPRSIDGHGLITNPGEAGRATAATVQELHPDWRQVERGQFGDTDSQNGNWRDVLAVPPGCDPAVHTDEVYECKTQATLLPRELADPAVALTAEQERMLAAGGVLVGRSDLITGGVVRLAVVESDDQAQRRVIQELTVPAAAIDPRALNQLTFDRSDIWMLPETAQDLKLPTQTSVWEVINPAGAISATDQAEINDRTPGGIEVERGPQSELGMVIAILVGLSAALVLVGSLIATALSQSEAAADLSTLASLGGTVGLRRRLAAAQAALIAATGSALGVIVGILPGVAFASTYTSRYAGEGQPDQWQLVVPWLPLLATVVIVPLLAAGLAAISIKRLPIMTRRLG